MKRFLKGFSPELVRGFLGVTGQRIAGLAVGYVYITLAARLFGAAELGKYQLGVQLVGTCTLFAGLGFNQLVLKYSSRMSSTASGWTALRRLSRQWGSATLVSALALSGVVAALAGPLSRHIFGDAEARPYVLLVSALVPLHALAALAHEFLRGTGRVVLSEYFRSIHVRIVNLGVLLGLFYVFGRSPDYLFPSFGIATLSSFLLLVVLVARQKGPATGGEDGEDGEDGERAAQPDEEALGFRDGLRESIPMYQSSILIFASTQALVYVLAYFEGPAEVAKYNVSLQLANLSGFVFSAVVTVSAPMYARDLLDERHGLRAHRAARRNHPGALRRRVRRRVADPPRAIGRKPRQRGHGRLGRCARYDGRASPSTAHPRRELSRDRDHRPRARPMDWSDRRGAGLPSEHGHRKRRRRVPRAETYGRQHALRPVVE